jgi:hypothetical protein
LAIDIFSTSGDVTAIDGRVAVGRVISQANLRMLSRRLSTHPVWIGVAGQVAVDYVGRDREVLGHLLDRLAAGDRAQHLQFALGELG